jgi:hypothetical protein
MFSSCVQYCSNYPVIDWSLFQAQIASWKRNGLIWKRSKKCCSALSHNSLASPALPRKLIQHLRFYFLIAHCLSEG